MNKSDLENIIKAIDTVLLNHTAMINNTLSEYHNILVTHIEQFAKALLKYNSNKEGE